MLLFIFTNKTRGVPLSFKKPQPLKLKAETRKIFCYPVQFIINCLQLPRGVFSMNFNVRCSLSVQSIQRLFTELFFQICHRLKKLGGWLNFETNKCTKHSGHNSNLTGSRFQSK